MMKNKCTNQTAKMDRLVCNFVVRMQQSPVLSHRGPYSNQLKKYKILHPFLGQDIVQIQIRHHRLRCLISEFTVYVHNVLVKLVQ